MNTVKVFIATEVRIYRVNNHYYADAPFAKIIERYSKNFGKVTLATRILDDDKKKKGYVQIDDYCCEFDGIGSLRGFLLKKTPDQIISHFKESDLIILRLPSVISVKMHHLIKKYSKKYLTEVMGCAWDGYWNHGLTGKMIAPLMFFNMRRIVKNADYGIYVTQQFLQKRYPNKNMENTIGISNVDIKSVDSPKKYDSFDKNNFSMMTAAALNVKYKGQEYVIKAIKRLKNKYGINVIYYLAGKGDDARLKRIAEKNGVLDNVVFCGMLSRDELSKKMREVDFYIQPSLQEGLPRSLIEAMSHGTVCMGSNVAGIPELLENDKVFRSKCEECIIDVIIKLQKGDTVVSARGTEPDIINASVKAYIAGVNRLLRD